MKKFYAFAAAAMMAATAMAQNGAPLYCTGDFATSNWAPDAPIEFTFADGKYTLDIEGTAMFKISTAMGDWDTFNAGCLTCNYGEEPGATIALEPGDANILCPWAGDYHVVVAGDLSTITLTTETPKPTGATAVYLRGDMNGWGAEDAWKMTSTDGVTYTFACADDQSIPAGVAFKFADANWASINYGAEEVLFLDQEFELGYNGSNITLEEEWSGSVKLVLGENQTATVEFSNDKSAFGAVAGIAVDNNVAPVYYNLQGVRVNNPENGLFIVVKGNETSKVLVK